MRLIDAIRCMKDSQEIMINDIDRKDAPPLQIRKVGNLTWHDFKMLERKRVIHMGIGERGDKHFIFLSVTSKDYDLYREG